MGGRAVDDTEIEGFFSANAGLYSAASDEDLEQLKKISLLFPDSVRLLREPEAVPAEGFTCQRCGACCSEVKFIPVCHSDVLRWVAQARWDVFDRIVVDRRRTPMMAVWGREAIAETREKARAALEGIELDDDRRRKVTEILYVTDLVECAVYVDRDWGHCAFFSGETNSCTIYDTRPRVCAKFPFYVGTFTDARLLKISFCPGLRELAGPGNGIEGSPKQ
ncbi:MAG: Flagellin N-methylase [Methanocella sp. PtaU1.Bin125]|nr:MAG: Flagellin N-methylase [Methanocella sp. PtaU1.Bin125]